MIFFRQKLFFLLFFCCAWLFLFSQTAFAQVIINEIYPNPNPGENEWVELYNSGSAAIDLLNWKLWDQESSPGIAHHFTEQAPIEPQGYLVVSMHNILNNSGDTVILKNPQEQTIDTLGYTSSAKSKSWARDPDNPAVIFETSPTKGGPNLAPAPTPTPTPTPSAGFLSPELSEIMACPDDSAEWVELYNPHDSELPLLGFSLRDSKNKILGFTDEKLEPKEYAAFELRNVLNNGGDTVSLISPDNQVADSFLYSQCSAALSWVKQGENWEQTAIITQHAPNIFSESSNEEDLISIDSTGSDSQSNPSVGPVSEPFTYPLSVLKPKLSYEKPSLPSAENLAFHQPPQLERGALSVIMGSSLLLIPGFIYAKNRQKYF